MPLCTMLVSALAVSVLSPVHQSACRPHHHTKALALLVQTTSLLAVLTRVWLEACSANKLKLPARRRMIA